MEELFQSIFDLNFELLKDLIKSGIQVEDINENGWSLLHAAVSVNRLDIIQYLIEDTKILLDFQCFEGKTSLMLACELEDTKPEIIKYLLSSGADVNIGNNDGITPIHAACRNGNTAILNLLIQYNANVNIQEFNGYTPLHYAALSNCVETLNLLLSLNDSNVTVDINAIDFDGCTALMLAVDVANCEVAMELVKLGADVNIIGRDTTALHLSVVTQQIDLFKLLWYKTDFSTIAMLSDSNNLMKLMVKYGWFFPDRVEILFEVLNHRNIHLIVAKEAKILQTFFYRIRFVKNVYDIDMAAVLKSFLKVMTVNQNDLRAFLQIFYKYEFRYEMLDILINDGCANFDDTELILFAVDLFPNLVPTLLSFCIRVNPIDIFMHFTQTRRINKNMLRFLTLILHLCTPNAVLKKKCKLNLMTYSFSENFLEQSENDEQLIEIYKYVISLLKCSGVPTLKELCRDVTRNNLARFCMNSLSYLKFLNKLELARDIIDLIQCKMAVHLL